MKTDPKTAAARAFVRSLNILLKFARLYGFDHGRTTEQLDTAWRELRTAVPAGSEAGLLLGATGSQLLLDGVPLEGAPAECQFAQLLAAAGLASVQFFPFVTQEELGRFLRAFPTGKAKPSELAEQLKTAMAGAQGIRINEICFVATDARLKEASVAAQLAATALGADSNKFKDWLNDPQKLLELIAAAQGAKSGGAGQDAGSEASSGPEFGTGAGPDAGEGVGGGAGAGTGSAPVAAGSAGMGIGLGAGLGPGRGRTSEDDMLVVLQALASLGQGGGGTGAGVAPGPFQEQVSKLPGQARDTLQQALASLAAKAPEGKPDESVLVRLAEHLAIRFALERYERGEVHVNAVRQLLDRMGKEIENLRKILGAHEEKMSEAGLVVETCADILDRQFWAAVPESSKGAVLMSPEAWCIPPRNVRQYVSGLIERGQAAEAFGILNNYAACASNDQMEARRRMAMGLAELADLYAQGGAQLLGEALRQIGVRLSVEHDAELQALVSAAFVRLSQAAASSHCFPAMEQALKLLAGVENQRPGVARNLRPKMGVEERVPEFLEEALRARKAAAGLTEVLRLMPQTAMEQLRMGFNRSRLGEDCEQIAGLAGEIGPDGIAHLRGTLRGAPVAEAVDTVGLLSRLETDAVEIILPVRMHEFPRSSQDRIVRQIAAGGSPARCRILLAILDQLDPLVMPVALDEIGLTGDRDALSRLLCIADGDLPAGAGPYVRVKAVEALGRLHSPESAELLRRLVEEKHMWRWENPQELRIVALQALEKLDPGWAREFLPKSGLEKADLALAPLDVKPNSRWVRQRRHVRVRLPKPLSAVTTNLKENCRLEIKTASLTGGVAHLDRHIQPGTQVQLKLGSGLRGVTATALMRDYRAQDMAFEIVDISLDERSRLRHLLAENIAHTDPMASSSETQGAAVLSR